jgi:hypothetical protein
VNFEPDFDAPDRPGLISRQEAAELAGMKAPPRQVSEHNSGMTYSDDGIAVTYGQGGQWPKATVTWTIADLSDAKANWAEYGGWNKPSVINLGKGATIQQDDASQVDTSASALIKYLKSKYGSQDKPMRFEWNPEPFDISQGNPPPAPDDTATQALKARQNRNTGPKRPDAGHSKRKRKHRG